MVTTSYVNNSLPTPTITVQLLNNTYWYLSSGTLECGYSITGPLINTINTNGFQTVNQPVAPWTLNGNTLVTTYGIYVNSVSAGSTALTQYSPTNYWYFTDNTQTNIYTPYPISIITYIP